MKKSWLKEIARDLLALGSIPFYFLVVIRAIIGKYNVFVYQMLAAAIAIFILCFIIKGSDLHVARAFAAVVFTSLFYKERIYTIFAGLVWVLLLFAAYYTRKNLKSVIKGILVGAIGFLAGYYATLYLL